MSNYYEPYEKIQQYTTLPNSEVISRKLIDYLLDMPSVGHTPFESNDCPRVRIAKYLYWDNESPLSQTVPTTDQKLSIIFDPKQPFSPSDKVRGYRVFPMMITSQAQTEAQTRLYLYMGNIIPTNSYRADVSVTFRVWCNTMYDTNTKESAMSRSYSIAQAIVEALNGVNLGVGIGTFYFDRRQHPECGIRAMADETQNVGYQITMGLTIEGEKTFE